MISTPRATAPLKGFHSVCFGQQKRFGLSTKHKLLTHRAVKEAVKNALEEAATSGVSTRVCINAYTEFDPAPHITADPYIPAEYHPRRGRETWKSNGLQLCCSPTGKVTVLSDNGHVGWGVTNEDINDILEIKPVSVDRLYEPLPLRTPSPVESLPDMHEPITVQASKTETEVTGIDADKAKVILGLILALPLTLALVNFIRDPNYLTKR